MTRKEAIRQTHQENTLVSLGFTATEANTLRRISMTLSRWAEHECNGTIERDGENGDGLPYWSNPNTGRHMISRIPDREAGAIKRLKSIVTARNQRVITARPEPSTITGCAELVCDLSVSYYIQGDPRGCALYILRPGDVPDGQAADGYYSRGIAVY